MRLKVKGPKYHFDPEVLNKIVEAQIPHCHGQGGLEQVDIEWSYMCTLLQHRGSSQKRGQLNLSVNASC